MQQTKPFFSVVIPVYNKATTLKRTLRSVLEQTFNDFEIVAVDDGSSDKSLSILQNAASRHANLRIIRQKNAGVSAARNHGTRESKGEWIAFLDADDVWLPKMLQELLALIERFPEVGMVGTNYYQKVGSCLCARKRNCRVQKVDFYREFKPSSIPFHTSSHAIKADELRQVGGYDERISFYEDAELMFRVANNVCVAASGKPCAVYMDDGNARLTSKAQRLRETSDLIKWPHIDWLERMCKSGKVTKSQLVCGKTWVLSALEFGMFSKERRRRVQMQFPCLYRQLSWIYRRPLLSIPFFLGRKVVRQIIRLLERSSTIIQQRGKSLSREVMRSTD